MHERNPYNSPIDFASLSEEYPKLKSYLTKSGGSSALTIDFKNADAQRCLTEALLWRDFRLTLTLPEGRLCPPVPNRLNYLLWIQDVLYESFRCVESPSEIVGIDIGTGASAIYPLLGCKVDPGWKFIGTEIDQTSFTSAVTNVEKNHLTDRVEISRVTSSDFILTPFHIYPNRTFAFTMCNPPFYADASEIERNAEGKALEPSSVCTGAEVEMITPGGEVSFVTGMILESMNVDVKDRCLWFTSMLGKLSTLSIIVDKLRTDYKIDNYAVTELVQGQTRRWVVAWSFSDIHLPDYLARDLPSAHHALLPPHNNFEQVLLDSGSINTTTLREAILNILTPLAGVTVVPLAEQSNVRRGHITGGNNIAGTLPVSDNGDGVSFRVSTIQNSWSRKARRAGIKSPSVPHPSDPPAMIADISAIRRTSKGGGERGGYWVLTGVWRKGRDRDLFESFWSHVSRKVCSAVQTSTRG